MKPLGQHWGPTRELRQKLAAATRENAKLREQVESLTAENASLIAAGEWLIGQHAELEARAESLTTELAEAKRERVKAEGERDHLIKHHIAEVTDYRVNPPETWFFANRAVLGTRLGDYATVAEAIAAFRRDAGLDTD